jgi:hypothetical protein
MAKKPYIIRYFQLKIGGLEDKHSALELSHALTSLSQLNIFANYSSGGTDYVLHNKKLQVDKEGFYFGTIVKNQVDNIAKYNSKDGSLIAPTPGEWLDGDGVAYEKCFMIDPAVNIICIQSRQNGASSGAILRWLETNLRRVNLDVSLTISSVIRPDALNRFKKLKGMHSIRYRLADVTKATYLDDGKRKSVESVVHVADDSNADIMEFTMKTFSDKRGKNRESLEIPFIKKMITGFKSMTGMSTRAGTDSGIILSSVYIQGVDENGELAKFDLIEDELVDTINVASDSQRIKTTFNTQDHINELAHNYRRIRAEVLGTYEVKK